jgi:hypothetical protein
LLKCCKPVNKTKRQWPTPKGGGCSFVREKDNG